MFIVLTTLQCAVCLHVIKTHNTHNTEAVNYAHALSNCLWRMCLPVSTQCFLFLDSNTRTDPPKVLGVVRRCRSSDVLSQSSKGSTAEIKQLAERSAKS